MRFLTTAAIALSFTLLSNIHSIAQDKPADKPADKKAASETLKFAEGKLVLTTPESWKVVPPKNNMVAHEFRFPAEGEESARITFSVATGSVQQNVDRWIGQFEGAKKEDIKTEKKDVSKTVVHTVDITGTFKDSMGGGPFAPGPVKKKENYRMLGGILEVPDGTKVFVKVTGPKEIVAKTKDDFVKMLDGLKNN